MSDNTRTAALEQYIVDHLDEAIANGWIVPYFQPVIRTISRQLCGMEALARWEDPVWGLLPPDSFISILERHRRIHELDACIVRRVCETYRRAVQEKGVVVPFSINLSRLDYELCDIFEVVEDAVQESRMPRNLLCIEITESALNENGALMRRYIGRFRSAGYQVWMDDFGSGYSSLNVLKDYEFDELKVDMWFLSDLHQRSKKILSSIVHMAKEIEIQTLVEGVETEDQFMFLRNIGCEKVQGYLFGKPMPYRDCVRHVLKQGLLVEAPVHRKYYDDLGRLDVLSATPFLSPGEKKRLTTGREQNSIPLAVLEMQGDNVRLLFTNDAFDDASGAVDWLTIFGEVETDPEVKDAIRLRKMSTHVRSLLEETRSSGSGKMYFVDSGEYFEITAKRVSVRGELCSVLLRMTNLSRGAEIARQESLDDGLRKIYAMYDQVAMLDLEQETFTPLYLDSREIQAPAKEDLWAIHHRYAEEWVYAEDRQRYLRFTDPATLAGRIAQAGTGFVSTYLRTRLYHGSYIWKVHILIHVRQSVYFMLVRDAEADVRELRNLAGRAPMEAADAFSPALLWKNFTLCGALKFFWKDAERRFRGASQSFLDFYGFQSLDDILGKTDEDMGWHLHPDSYQSDEWAVIREGEATHDVPGSCIVRGENRKIVASKMPLHDDQGQIMGLLGYFFQVDESPNHVAEENKQVRTDALTGLLNARGLTEELYAYRDEYDLRKADFARIVVDIADFQDVNRQYGYDFGDNVIRAVGDALVRRLGRSASVGRVTGSWFVVLTQFRDHEELASRVESIRAIPGDIQSVEGIPFSLYLSVGVSVFSETEDTNEQAEQARLRMLADGGGGSFHQTSENVGRAFRLYDNLPVAYAVFRFLSGGEDGEDDGLILYANAAFSSLVNWYHGKVAGKKASEIFPMMDPRWFEMARRAAVEGKSSEARIQYDLMDVPLYLTASQIIGPGYCAFTYQIDHCVSLEPEGSE